MSSNVPTDHEAAAMGGGTRWKTCAVLGAVCALVIGVYAWSANSGVFELLASGAQDSYYNLLVRGFRDGHLNLKTEVPPGIAQIAHYGSWLEKHAWLENHGVYDLSYYKGKLYLYFGVTPALVLFWPYVALTGHYLMHKDAGVIFFAAGFLAGAGLLWAVWRRYFEGVGVGVLAAGMLALGLANFAPAVLGRCDVYEVAISCGYALMMLALVGIWCAMHDERRRWRWLAAASLAYGLAVGARPSLLFGGIILLGPVVQAWREKRRTWGLLLAAVVPMVLVGVGLMFYNALRFDNPLEFGQRYQLPMTVHRQFGLSYLWFNFRVAFLEPAHWSWPLPFVHDFVTPPLPAGYGNVHHPFGVLTNIPVVWLALAVPLAWRNRSAEVRSSLRWFLGAVALLFGTGAMTMCLHDSMCLRYETEFSSPLVFLAAVGMLALERSLARQPAWRRATRCGWGLLLTFSVAFSLLAGFELQADNQTTFGADLLQAGKVDEAIAQFQKAVQLEPADIDAHCSLGSALLLKGEVDEAEAHFQRALDIKPDYWEAHNSVGNALLQCGRVDEAIAQYQATLRIKPDDETAHNNLGNALLQQGRVDDAITQYQKAVQSESNSAPARSNLGNALLQKGRVDEAITQYEMALQLNPDYTEAYNNLGNALLQKGRVDEAIACFQKALQINPDYTDAYISLGNAFVQKGNVDDAILLFQKALEIKPDTAVAHQNLGNALLQKGQVDEAIAHLQQALQLKPGQPDAHFNFGNALLQKGRLDEGIAQFQQALQIKPDYTEAHINLGSALLQSGRVDEGIAQYQQALQIKPDYMEVHLNLANVLLQKGRLDEAIAHFQMALQLKPADPGIQNTLAWLLATCPRSSLRNGGKAVELARQANGLTGGEDPIVLHTLAAAYAEAGRYSEAVETAQHALRLAGAQSNAALAGALESELKLYQAGSPFHSPEQPQ